MQMKAKTAQISNKCPFMIFTIIIGIPILSNKSCRDGV